MLTTIATYIGEATVMLICNFHLASLATYVYVPGDPSAPSLPAGPLLPLGPREPGRPRSPGEPGEPGGPGGQLHFCSVCLFVVPWNLSCFMFGK